VGYPESKSALLLEPPQCATLKLKPSVAIGDGTASAWSFAFTIVIGSAPVCGMSVRLELMPVSQSCAGFQVYRSEAG
jgi:hypothetical protein